MLISRDWVGRSSDGAQVRLTAACHNALGWGMTPQYVLTVSVGSCWLHLCTQDVDLLATKESPSWGSGRQVLGCVVLTCRTPCWHSSRELAGSCSRDLLSHNGSALFSRFMRAFSVCRKPPLMHFRLDFGKAFGGSFTAKGVRLWLDPFIRETLTEMIVWPNRIVVPILPEEQAGPLDHLYLRYFKDICQHQASCVSLWHHVLHSASAVHSKQLLAPFCGM